MRTYLFRYRVLASLLSAGMLLSMLPISAGAQEIPFNTGGEIIDSVPALDVSMDIDMYTDADTGAGIGPYTGMDTDTGVNTNMGAGMDTDTGIDTSTDTGTETDTATDTGTAADIEMDVDADADTGELELLPKLSSDLPPSQPSGMSRLTGGVESQAAARGIVGYTDIQVRLTAGTFAANGVLNHSHWTLTASAGQTIQGISRINDSLVVLNLSAPVSAGQTFTITAVDSSQFASGTAEFTMPLEVEIKVPTPAAGEAAAAAGTKDITVTLSQGEFNTYQQKSYWTLGGTSSTGNAISSVTCLDINNIRITLDNNIGGADHLTVTASAGAFADVATRNFDSPLTVDITGGSSTTQLATPSGLSWDTSTPGVVRAKWNAVESVSSYSVMLYKIVADSPSLRAGIGPVLVNETEFALSIFESYGPGDYAFTVTASAGTGSGFTDSAVSSYSPYYAYTQSAKDCAIDSTEYDTLVSAILAAKLMTGEVTIKLLRNINRIEPLIIQNQDIIFDLGGYNLSIDTSAMGGSAALTVDDGSVGYNGPGTFTVCGGSGDHGAGVKVQQGGKAVLSGIIIKTAYGRGAWALDEGSKIAVNGNIQTAGSLESTRTVGADARMGAEIHVNGAISLTGGNCIGAYTEAGGKVIVTPPVSSDCIFVQGEYSMGALARNDPGSEVTVNGSIRAEGYGVRGAEATFGLVTVNGDVTVEGNDSYGVLANDVGRVHVNGHVTVTGDCVTGVRAEVGEGSGGIVRVTRNVVLISGTDETSIGVYCYSRETAGGKSAVTVDGVINAPLYLEIDNELRGKELPDGTDAGYEVYNGQNGSLVKVGSGDIVSDPATVTTALVNPAEVTATGARVRGSVTATGGAGITAFGFAWGLNADPTTANFTAAGTGTAAGFMADLSGLVPNQTYYVRAYATNSVGTAYGENRTFTTAASDPLAAPMNLRYLAYDGSVELFWDAPSSASQIIRYEIMRGSDLTKPWIDVGNVTSHMVTGLTNGENYIFSIRAVNADGPGAHNFLWAAPNIPTAPGKPHSLHTSGGDGWVRMSWQAPLYTGYRPITGYYVSTDNFTWSDLVTDTSYRFTGLTNGVDYNFYVRAVNAVGPGEAASAHGMPRSTGGGYVGGGSGSGPAASSAVLPEEKPDRPVISSTKIQAMSGINGGATVTITDSIIKSLLEAARSEAGSTGKSANGIGAEVNILLPQTAGNLIITMEAAAIDRLESAGVRMFTASNPLVNFTLDTEAIRELNRQTTGAVTISAKPVTALSAAAKRVIGFRPVFNLTVSYQSNGNTISVSDFGKGRITLGIAYTPRTGGTSGSSYGIGGTSYQENPGYLRAIYIGQTGNPQVLQNSAYDNGRIIFGRNSLSVYGIGYMSPAEKYTDISGHWAKDSIDYAVGRGLFAGTADTIFSPDTAMDRGMLVTVLGRLAGADVSACETSSFTDVAAGKYYLPYVEWAYGKGIVQGIGNGRFAPDRAITRQEMAVILQNYAKATGCKLPVTRNAVTFADVSGIGSAYKTAVKAMQQAGIMMGEQNNRYNPTGNVTRAEASAMLHRYVKLTIDPATAQGWALNDDGQWLYCKDGIMAADKWLEIGGKWYYFNTDGSLARNTTVDGHEIDKNGVRKPE